MNSKEVKEKLGVQNRDWVACNKNVYSRLTPGDWFINAAPKIGNIVRKGIKTLIYNGKDDYVCNWQGTRDWFNTLKNQLKNEKGAENFGEFKFITIEGAGHMVPMDQPEIASKMINEYIK